MQQSGRTYIAIDLKSYYASVECMERGLDPMTTNLVVADLSRTEKTICLAVSPSLKAYGISGRARLFEVVERVKEVNAERRRKAGGNLFEKSCDAHELAVDPSRAVGYGDIRRVCGPMTELADFLCGETETYSKEPLKVPDLNAEAMVIQYLNYYFCQS